MLAAFIAFIYGLVVGSFANVVIYRLPAGKSIVFPGSACPKCGHQLSPLELIPVFSWLFLRGRCKSCQAPISARYPAIELLMGVGYALLAWRFPFAQYGVLLIFLLVLYSMLLIVSMIDIDTQLLPDVIVFPALGLALLMSVFGAGGDLPNLSQALWGAGVGAGVLVLLNRLGALVMRRFGDTSERLWPIGMDQVNIAALFGTFGWPYGLLAAFASLLANLLSKKSWRLPEGIMYLLWLFALILGTLLLPRPESAILGSLSASGAVALLGGLYWWLYELRHPEEAPPQDDDEPVALGFGDVKLMGVLGAMVGLGGSLVALLFAFVLGAVGGVIGKFMGKGRVVPFGPYLVLGGLIALFVGKALIQWYLP